MDLRLCVIPGDRGTIVRVSGEVDVSTEGPLQDLLLRVMRAHSPGLLLDLSGVSFMDCAGLRVLVRTRRRAELRHGSVRLIAASAAVRQIINLTGMREALPVRDHWGDTAHRGDRGVLRHRPGARRGPAGPVRDAHRQRQ